jgi:hypothetical protein
MNFDTQLYGLRLRSNCKLPGLVETSDVGPVDVRIDFSYGPLSNVPAVDAVKWRSQPIIETACGFHRVFAGTSREGRFWRLWYGCETRCQSVEFVIHPNGRQVWAFRQFWGDQHVPISIEDSTTVFLGAVMGMVLRLRGMICLHASVAAVGSRAVVILGSKGAGKSSMAATLAERGHAVLSDDVAVITKSSGSYAVHAGYPRLRLWPATLRALNVDLDLTPVLSTFDKRYLELNEENGDDRWRFQSEPLPLGTIYLLKRDDALDGPEIELVPAAERLATLIEHTSVRFMPLEAAQRKQEFAEFGRLAMAVPFFRIHRPDGVNHLTAQCEAITNIALKFAVNAA